MRCIGAACLAWVLLTAPVLAAGYDDFTSGMTANLRGESERAVASFTAALAAPDLVPAYKPAAYRGRAAAYLALEAVESLIEDCGIYSSLEEFGIKEKDFPALADVALTVARPLENTGPPARNEFADPLEQPRVSDRCDRQGRPRV